MILTDRQLGISNGKLAELKSALAKTETQSVDVEWVKQLEVDSLKSLITEIEEDIARYEMLRSGRVTFAESFSLDTLSNVLIETRIASGKSQTDLAEEIGVNTQQIQRYESTNYMGASPARLREISKALNVHSESLFTTDAK